VGSSQRRLDSHDPQLDAQRNTVSVDTPSNQSFGADAALCGAAA
jgi:hypothetical protein